MTTDMTVINYRAKIDPLADTSIPPSSWFITHQLGGPAAGMYTEVRMPDSDHIPDQTKSEIVRRVADELYGRQWAFHYRPYQYESSIEKYGLTRREVIVVTDIEVWSS
jgi:hypothetical protein